MPRTVPGTSVPLLPVLVVVAGGYLAWFAVHYWRDKTTVWPSDPVKAVLTGKGVPAPAPESASDHTLPAAPAGAGSPSNTAGAAGDTGNAIANDALRYKGAGYVYGGNASAIGDWDCSSFVSYVLGHDLGIALPGGNWGDPGFPPNAHGPTTLDYMLYGDSINQSDVQAGDLIVSTDHIGIAISTTEMISAEDEQSGTNVAGFPGGFPAGPPIYRRVTASGSAQPGGAGPNGKEIG